MSGSAGASAHARTPRRLSPSVVVMGVAGCGKSTLGAGCAKTLEMPFVEGDDYHSETNIEKMRRGEPLTDADRAEWLLDLADRLAAPGPPIVLACSALRLAYRDQLRAASARLCFLYLQLTPAQARARVASRGYHPFPESLVSSQFETLEPPTKEDDVLFLDAGKPQRILQSEACAWILSAYCNEGLR